MARPQKEGLSYFPHDVGMSSSDGIERLEAVYQNDGYAVYNKFLERIYKNGGKIFIEDDETLKYYSDKFNINDTEKLIKIINFACVYGLFNKKLWEHAKCLTSPLVMRTMKVVKDKRLRMKKRYKEKVSAEEIKQNHVETPESKEK